MKGLIEKELNSNKFIFNINKLLTLLKFTFVSERLIGVYLIFFFKNQVFRDSQCQLNETIDGLLSSKSWILKISITSSSFNN